MGSRSGFDADGDFGEIQIPVDKGSGAVSVASRQALALLNLGLNSGTPANPSAGVPAYNAGVITPGHPLASQVVTLDSSGNVAFPGTVTGGMVGVLDETGATVTLTAAQSGSLILLDKSGGVTVTLPAAVAGTWFTFAVKVTSTANKIITAVSTTFLQGGLFFDKALTITRYDGNGTSHISLNFNGTTTGGIAGDVFQMYCLSATEWNVSGTVAASGTLATPFATT